MIGSVSLGGWKHIAWVPDLAPTAERNPPQVSRPVDEHLARARRLARGAEEVAAEQGDDSPVLLAPCPSTHLPLVLGGPWVWGALI